MLLDAAQVDQEVSLQVDLCIVGSGPAGLTLAREMAGAGHQVCLLESGGKTAEAETQKLCEGSVDSADGYRRETLQEGRRRQLGGTANLWNHEMRGESARHIRYVPLDEIDFEKRDWIPESGWPFSKKDLLPFYERAQQICGIGKFDYRAEGWSAGGNERQPWQTNRIESVISQFGSAQTFLEEHGGFLQADPRVTVITHAVLQRLQMDPLSREITSAEATTLDGRPIRISARLFVLAAGGLENARLLLLQDHLQEGGLGNQHDMVGRCFMDHPSITLGTLQPASGSVFAQAAFYDQHNVNGQAIMGKLHVRPEVQRREGLLNLCAVLVPHFRNLRSNTMAVARQLLAKGPRHLLKSRAEDQSYSVSEVPSAMPIPLRQRLLQGYYSECFCGWSKLSSLPQRFGEFGVRSLVEQSPDRSNRLLLGDTRDTFGQRQIKLIWRWNELDLRSVRRTQEIFREELAAGGWGTFHPEPEQDSGMRRSFYSPHHFLGSTRMHQDPHHGVVDADCRVHETANLFVAGGSVFPTGGFANPTLTIVALTLRLADHLKATLRQTPEVNTQTILAAR